MTKPSSQVFRIQLIVAFLCVALVVYFVMLGRSGVILMQSGEAAAIGLGIGIFVLPLIGLWAMVATLRAGFAHQRLARRVREDGLELDVSELPRMPSGRIRREAADALIAWSRGQAGLDLVGSWVHGTGLAAVVAGVDRAFDAPTPAG